MNKCHLNTELSSHEGTRCQFNGGRCAIKLGIDVHQDFYVVVEQVEGSNPKPPQRFAKGAFLHWAAKLKSQAREVHAVYEACGFGFGLQRNLTALGIKCHVVCPQKLDEHNKRVKTDGLDAKALCLKLDRFVQGNRLEAQGRSLMVNVVPSGKYCVKASFSVLPSSESVQCAVRSVRPFILRTTSQLLGPFTVMDRVVPLRAGWSLPSATTVSTWPGPKVKVYLLAPTASTFISSVSVLLDRFTFHLP